MAKIHEILKLNLEEDIKNVIDLEDRSEAEVRSEIDSYIVTENIGGYFSDFAARFKSGIKETGVWISGFYGSGKSYFGKMLGYVLENSDIMGTPAAERFILRLSGLKNAGLIENDIRSLSADNVRVVSLDVAKQSTAHGLAFTLFRNFLRSLGFLDNVYGYMEYSLFMDDRYDAFCETVQEMNDANWSTLRKNPMRAPIVMKKTLLARKWYSEAEYTEMLHHLNSIIKDFSAGRLKEELRQYLENTDEKIVFIFDEASEAISQKKYDLLDLEGLSEAMSGIGSKVWTVAIAQEKLDDVINNSNITKSQLTKVTDRFKTKIHLESTEVDIIIKNRLLRKKDRYYRALVEFYKRNEGTLSDATGLKSSFPTKVQDADECAVYYPFHRYQFDLLQRFLFSSNALAATQVAARGMIITTFDVLRNRLRNRDLFDFAPAAEICDEAQTAPPSALVNKYDNARKIIDKADIAIDGRRLLKTIHFLSEAELVPPTPENIARSYVHDIHDYYKVKKDVDDALDILTRSRILLAADNVYKITSDLETRLLDEMNAFVVQLYIKKRNLMTWLKKSGMFKDVSTLTDGSTSFRFSVLSDQDDDIMASSDKHLQIRVFSLYSITDDEQAFIETVKLDTRHDRGRISVIPRTGDFSTIDGLIEEVQRHDYMQEKYGNDQDVHIRQIIREFSVIRADKEKLLIDAVVDAYKASSAVYLFDATPLSENDFTPVIQGLQKKAVKNVYTKRPAIQISEKAALSIMKEKSDNRLHQYNQGDDFRFFDANGNFVGQGLTVVEALTGLIKTGFVDGKSIETELAGPPFGYAYGTVAFIAAALFRAGRLTAKFKGDDYFSYKDKDAADIFATGRNFQKAAFKALTKSLTSAQKNEIVQALLDMKYQSVTGEIVDWNTNDFQLVDAVRNMARHLITAVDTLRKTVDRFDALFAGVDAYHLTLSQFSGKTTESNYLEQAQRFLECRNDFKASATGIAKIEKFVKKNLDKAADLKRFVDDLSVEIEKSGIHSEKMTGNIDKFRQLYEDSVVDRFRDILDVAQKLKDAYFALIRAENGRMTDLHTALCENTETLIQDIRKLPEAPNRSHRQQAENILKYAKKRINPKIELGKSIQCKNCNMSLSEMKSSIALIPAKKTELDVIRSSLVKQAVPDGKKVENTPKKITLKVPGKMTVGAYRKLLSDQLGAVSGLDESAVVEIDVEK